MNNRMSLKIMPKPGNEAFARSCIAAFAAQLNPTIDQLSDIKTAVSEAVTNSIVHGGLSNEDFVVVDAELSESAVHIAVIDDGVGIENVEKAMQPFFTTKQNEERTGMGFTIMSAFMDSLKVEKAQEGKGVVVKMSKVIRQ